MKTISLIMLLCLAAGIPCYSGTIPSMTGEVSIVDDVKVYTYTLTNDLDAGMSSYAFDIFMPEAGALAVTEAWCSRQDEGWSVYGHFQGTYSFWNVGGRYVNLLPGEILTLVLTTPADVPTAYNYLPYDWETNWRWYELGWGYRFGNSVLPVPVPEPSSIMALAGGIAGLGGFALRRRKN